MFGPLDEPTSIKNTFQNPKQTTELSTKSEASTLRATISNENDSDDILSDNDEISCRSLGEDSS